MFNNWLSSNILLTNSRCVRRSQSNRKKRELLPEHDLVVQYGVATANGTNQTQAQVSEANAKVAEAPILVNGVAAIATPGPSCVVEGKT